MQSKLVPETTPERSDDERLREANGFGRSGGFNAGSPRHVTPPEGLAESSQTNGDHRPRLHLSLGNGSGSQPEGGAQPTDSPAIELQHQAAHNVQPQHRDSDSFGVHSASAPQHYAGPFDHGRPAAARPELFEPARESASHPRRGNGAIDGGALKEGSASYIDRELRARVDDDIAAFLAAFDAALAQDSQESRSALREATDRLLRAGARTRIELERLEARLPLPAQNAASRAELGWRQR